MPRNSTDMKITTWSGMVRFSDEAGREVFSEKFIFQVMTKRHTTSPTLMNCAPEASMKYNSARIFDW